MKIVPWLLWRLHQRFPSKYIPEPFKQCSRGINIFPWLPKQSQGAIELYLPSLTLCFSCTPHTPILCFCFCFCFWFPKTCKLYLICHQCMWIWFYGLFDDLYQAETYSVGWEMTENFVCWLPCLFKNTSAFQWKG